MFVTLFIFLPICCKLCVGEASAVEVVEIFSCRLCYWKATPNVAWATNVTSMSWGERWESPSCVSTCRKIAEIWCSSKLTRLIVQSNSRRICSIILRPLKNRIVCYWKIKYSILSGLISVASTYNLKCGGKGSFHRYTKVRKLKSDPNSMDNWNSGCE